VIAFVDSAERELYHGCAAKKRRSWQPWGKQLLLSLLTHHRPSRLTWLAHTAILTVLLSRTWDSRTGQGVNLQGRGQGVVQGRGLENWSSRILEDKDFPRGQQHWREAVRHELEPDRDTMANKPLICHSVTARRWRL